MLDVYYEVWDVIAVWLILYPDFMMCCFYICSLFFFHVFLCTNFKTKSYISWIRDGRHWKGSEMFEILRFEKRQKTLANTCHPGFLDLLSYLWNLRLYIIQTSLFGGHMAISSLTVSFQFLPCFFTSEVAGSHTIRWYRGFFVWQDVLGYESVTFGAHFERVLFTPFWCLWMKNLALPCEASSQTVCFHMSIGQN